MKKHPPILTEQVVAPIVPEAVPEPSVQALPEPIVTAPFSEEVDIITEEQPKQEQVMSPSTRSKSTEEPMELVQDPFDSLSTGDESSSDIESSSDLSVSGSGSGSGDSGDSLSSYDNHDSTEDD